LCFFVSCVLCIAMMSYETQPLYCFCWLCFVLVMRTRGVLLHTTVMLFSVVCVFRRSAGLTHKRTKRTLRAPSCKGAPSMAGLTSKHGTHVRRAPV